MMSDADSSTPPTAGGLPGWEPYLDSGIPEIVAGMFPPEPQREQFAGPDGTVDEDAFEDAHAAWREESIDLAYEAARLPELLERLHRAEHLEPTEAERFRDAVIDLLQRDPLPVEPVKDDYLVTIAPAYEGEYEGMRFAWDHSQWRTAFTAAALRRDQVLQQLLQEGGPRTSFLPEQFRREWVPADLLALHTLRALIDSETGAVGVDETVVARLRAMLFAADPEIRVPDPDDPGGVELYAGEASEAHAWVPPGVYDATGPDREGEFRLVVGHISEGVTASAAFPPVEHDSQVLNEIARILERDTERHDPVEVLQRINAAVQGSGRVGALRDDLVAPEPPLSRLEHGVMLTELLAEREQHLDTPPDEPRPDAPGAGPERTL